MDEVEEQSVAVVDQQDALKSYLDSMWNSEEVGYECKNTSSIVDVSTVEKAVKLDGNRSQIIPEYAKDNFTVLTFKVSGMTIALPIAEVGSIGISLDRVNSVADMPNWISGVVEHKKGNAYITDIYKLFVPENMQEKKPKPKLSEDAQVGLLASGDYGFVYDEIGKTIVLRASDVCWKSENTSRPWLAGTITKHGCVLVDFLKISWYE